MFDQKLPVTSLILEHCHLTSTWSKPLVTGVMHQMCTH